VNEPRELVSIAVTTMPSMTQYTLGDVLDLSGMVVTATYSDESSKKVEGYTTDPDNGTALGTVGIQEIRVTYMEAELTVITSFNVIVIPDVMYPAVIVSNGLGAVGNGSYATGTSVSIFAGVAQAGYQFKNWTASSEVDFDRVDSVVTTFVMPAEPVMITAIFEPISDDAIEAYNKAYADFSSYYDSMGNGSFRRELFVGYTVESVLEAERIMDAAGQVHGYLLFLYGRFDGEHFKIGDDIAVIKVATDVLVQAIVDMNAVLKPVEVPQLFVEAYNVSSLIRVWLSCPVEVVNVVAVLDGVAVEFDGVLLSGARTWVPGVGYIDAYSYIDVAKTTDWELMVLTFMVNGQPLVYELVNDWYVPPAELVNPPTNL
ncbi:MAG: hypothetical protein FWD10_09685, partial [Candidatus Bathyarchaeota archaeon]|nr:hypothetical protein [Candidatus Termitimicrobium sp.]